MDEQSDKFIPVAKLLDEQKDARAALNRRRSILIIRNVIFCKRQGTPLCGHKDFRELSMYRTNKVYVKASL
jgi:hypothetical protein